MIALLLWLAVSGGVSGTALCAAAPRAWTPTAVSASQGASAPREGAARGGRSLDVRLFHLLNGDPGRRYGSDPLWQATNELGHPLVAMGIAGGLAAYGSLDHDPRSRDAGTLLALGLLLNGGITEGLKALVHRPRPLEELGEGRVRVVGRRNADGKSFPSGHASSAFTTATILSDFYPSASGWTYALASAVSLSRVRLGAHYPSDVVAGSLLGYLVGRLALSNGGLVLGEGWRGDAGPRQLWGGRPAPASLGGTLLRVRL